MGEREFSHLLGLQASIIDGAAFSDSHQLPLARLGKRGGGGGCRPSSRGFLFISFSCRPGGGERAIASPARGYRSHWRGRLPFLLPDGRLEAGRTVSALAGSQASPLPEALPEQVRGEPGKRV